ncbi:MAG: AIR synthase family protein [Chloroflexota bacterium]|nr:MAG: hydrogenase [Bellilinea sp.]
MNFTFPLGKLPHEYLEQLINNLPTTSERVILGPGIGLDCAVVEFGERCLVLKSEPITFATRQIGWYAVQIASNDIVTTGAKPQWMLLTMLLPENRTTPSLVNEISQDIAQTCQQMGIVLIGGHTEITSGLDRPILITTMIAETTREKLITPQGAQPGDILILTKGIPIEATALLAIEFPEKLANALSEAEIIKAQNFLKDPGISISRDAEIAICAGEVHAMHDPTEGGLATALWELAIASQNTLVIEPSHIYLPPISRKVCEIFGIDPMGAIASGALLMAVSPSSANEIIYALQGSGITASQIGKVEKGQPDVFQITPQGRKLLKKFERDEVARLFETIE